MAITLKEPEAQRCMVALAGQPRAAISAGTLAEALIVARGRSVTAAMEELIEQLALEVLPVTAASARRAAAAYGRWGKGVHPAALNMGDCFAYEAAREHGCPLLYIGNDFARTDITSAL